MLRTRRLMDADQTRLALGWLHAKPTRLNPYARGALHCGIIALIFLLVGKRIYPTSRKDFGSSSTEALDRALISYSYFEKDLIQLANFEFFLAVGMGAFSTFSPPRNTDFTIVVSGEKCLPCERLQHLLTREPSTKLQHGISAAWTSLGLNILYREENEGMDIAAHNTTLAWAAKSARTYKYYIFLNSSIRGPFVPSYMPQGWQWTQAFTSKITSRTKVVASSLVCLPALDAGGEGPKVESWAFATDADGLQILQDEGVLGVRTCKLCNDGIVVMGEYGLTKALFKRGFNIATLMSRYAQGIDWRDPQHQQCNNQVHPSRSGTYDGITMHPFETVFVKASWHVGEPFTAHYSKWFLQHAQGEAGTQGSFDETMYRYGVSPLAQEPRDREQCYRPNEQLLSRRS